MKDRRRENSWGILLIGAVALIIAILSGCQTTEPQVITKIVERKIEIPKSLLTCSDEPVAGSIWVSQKDVGRYMVRAAEAGEDCRAKLAAVKKLLDGQ